MEKIIVANHKMNMDFNQIQRYVMELLPYKDCLIVCPSNIYILYFLKHNFMVGLQNIYGEDFGNYTGEVSAFQAKSLGANYVIIGHSERRRLFGETDDLINKKIKNALKNHLKVILCVGHDDCDCFDVLKTQIDLDLKGINEEIIIAYEPIWAIGTEKIQNVDSISKTVAYIKSFFDYDVKVLYGGGISTKNINVIKGVKEIDGFLIGGASCKASDLIKIIRAV